MSLTSDLSGSSVEKADVGLLIHLKAMIRQSPQDDVKYFVGHCSRVKNAGCVLRVSPLLCLPRVLVTVILETPDSGFLRYQPRELA